MKVLVTGYNGQLGFDVVGCLKNRGIECIGVDLADFDITDEEQTKQYIETYGPDVVVHCAAYTAVDRAEEEPQLCHAVNVDGTRNIAESCRLINSKMVYISTDYVFPGTGEEFYDVDSSTGPISLYGKTKLSGEEEVKKLLNNYFIIRISWVFGKNGNNFVKTMLRLGREKDCISVVEDQIGSPTYTKDLAELICDMVKTEKYGTYHATNEGVCSFAEFAEEIFRVAGYDTKVCHITTAKYNSKAKRPLNSRLSKQCLVNNGFRQMPEWKDAVRRYIEEIKNEEY